MKEGESEEDSVVEEKKAIKLQNMFNLVDDFVAQRYEFIQKMGRGSYGTVWRAIDKADKTRVGIKKINAAF